MNLFTQNLKRNDLIKISQNLDFSSCKTVKINIHRNHSFEPIESIIAPFLHFSNLKAEFNLGAYDDALSLQEIKAADLEIIWLDLSRYKNQWQPHICTQIDHLRKISNAPILVLFMDLQSPENNFQYQQKQTHILFLSKILENQKNLLDPVKFSITATMLSNHACILLAQNLGLQIIPSILLPTLKAIVLDLDNTLYQGILGEDGIDGIILSKDHQHLQETIKQYKQQGFLLALASKNDESDVKNLFKQRKDFILQWEDFDTTQINWNNKRDNIEKIADFFNIGLDALLFIDDNLAEIENTKQLGIKTILATSPKDVLQTLKIFPQMYKTSITQEDMIRSKDIQANQIRKKLDSLSQEEYFNSLQISLNFYFNHQHSSKRIAELLNKTNQFISNYTRPTEQEVILDMQNKDTAIIAISMQDKLSDSGIIAIIRASKNNQNLYINDLCISCRALGRKLEEIILFKSCQILKEKFNIQSETFFLFYQQGERNLPFLNFLSQFTPSFTNNPVEISFKLIKTNGLKIKELY